MQSKTARADRVAAAMKGRTIAWLAGEIGCALSTAHSYVGGTVPPADVALRISEALAIDLRWYVNGEEARTAAGGVVAVPLVDHDFIEAGSMSYSGELIESLKVRPEDVKCILAQGAAMNPTIPEEAEVLYCRTDAAPHDGEVYMLSVGGKPIIRRVRRTLSGEWLAVCDNPAFHNEVREKVPADAFVGPVIWVSHRP